MPDYRCGYPQIRRGPFIKIMLGIDKDIGIEGIHLSHASFSIDLFSIKGNFSPKIKCPNAEWFRLGPKRFRRSDVMLQRRKQHFYHLNAVCQWGMLKLLYRFLRNHPSFLLISAFSPHAAHKRVFKFELPTHEPFDNTYFCLWQILPQHIYHC